MFRTFKTSNNNGFDLIYLYFGSWRVIIRDIIELESFQLWLFITIMFKR